MATDVAGVAVPAGARDAAPAQAAARALKFEGVQVLRAFAAGIVVFHHFCWVMIQYARTPSRLATYHRLAEVGASGVDVFFCISGLVITYSAMKLGAGRAAMLSFAGRRAGRVLPPYWIFTSGLLLMWVLGLGLKGLIVTPGMAIASYLLIPYPKTTVYGGYSIHPMLDVGWTLTFEMYFYIVCAAVILLWGGRRLFPFVLGGIALVAGVTAIVAPANSAAASILASPLLVEFGFGVLLAHFGERLMPAGRATRNRLGTLLLLGGVAALLGSAFLADPMGWRLLCWGVPGALMVLGAMMIEVDPAATVWRFPVFLGTASYTIYLAHPYATILAGGMLKAGHLQSVPPDLLLVAMTLATIIGTAASYPLIEGPLVAALKPRRRASA